MFGFSYMDALSPRREKKNPKSLLLYSISILHAGIVIVFVLNMNGLFVPKRADPQQTACLIYCFTETNLSPTDTLHQEKAFAVMLRERKCEKLTIPGCTTALNIPSFAQGSILPPAVP